MQKLYKIKRGAVIGVVTKTSRRRFDRGGWIKKRQRFTGTGLVGSLIE